MQGRRPTVMIVDDLITKEHARKMVEQFHKAQRDEIQLLQRQGDKSSLIIKLIEADSTSLVEHILALHLKPKMPKQPKSYKSPYGPQTGRKR